MPKTEAARLFGVGLSSVKRYSRLAPRGDPRPTQGRREAPKTNAAVTRLLEEDVGRRLYAAAREWAGFLRGASGVASTAATARWVNRFDYRSNPERAVPLPGGLLR